MLLRPTNVPPHLIVTDCVLMSVFVQDRTAMSASPNLANKSRCILVTSYSDPFGYSVAVAAGHYCARDEQQATDSTTDQSSVYLTTMLVRSRMSNEVGSKSSIIKMTLLVQARSIASATNIPYLTNHSNHRQARKINRTHSDGHSLCAHNMVCWFLCTINLS